ncbi:MAG: alanine racemase [Patescibacteria group bacterium]|nr:alanine racemase [Patescibacteria group bacterium]
MARPAAKTWLEISRSALRHNAAALKSLVAPAELVAVVKANAYGHGLAATVNAIDDIADRFAVDSLDEALAVRAAGSIRPVIILGYTPPSRLAEVVRHGFSQTIYDIAAVKLMSRHATSRRPAKVHIKLETGTSRQGVLAADLPALAKTIRKLPNLTVEGVHTHYANIEDTTDSSYAMLQLKRFRSALRLLDHCDIRPPLVHTACSAAAILFPETRFAAVRTGIALYGLWPSKETFLQARHKNIALKLQPALTWKTSVAQVKRLPAGTPVSYGLTEKLHRPSTIAVLPFGYYDGYDRGLSSAGEVLVNGHRCRILGRVCMNMCVVDVTSAGRIKPDDEVVLLGRQGREVISAEEIAGRIGTINYEIVSRINPLLPRVAVK